MQPPGDIATVEKRLWPRAYLVADGNDTAKKMPADPVGGEQVFGN